MAEENYTIHLKDIVDDFKLVKLYYPENAPKITVSSPDVNRPGLAFAGYFGHFDESRIQVIGKSESGYITTLTEEIYRARLCDMLSLGPPAIVYSWNIPADDIMLEFAERYKVPLLQTAVSSSEFTARLVSALRVKLAQRITRHGVFVEVYGEGILILGESGIGKSETAIELIKRGHRLIADDAVEIKKVSAITLLGSAPELIRHYVELRGIGLIDVRRLFGMGAVKETEKIDLVVNLEHWVQGKNYDRFGIDTQYTDIMDIKVATLTIPVRPGRNLAVVIEIAAMNNRQKKMGYNTAEEFNKKLLDQLVAEES
jgi:HPr kinase/phosphorylase